MRIDRDRGHRHGRSCRAGGLGSAPRHGRFAVVMAAAAVVVAACGGPSVATATSTTVAADTTAVASDTATAPAGSATTTAPVGNAAEWEYVALGSSFTGWATWPETYASFIEEDLGVSVTYHDRTINRAHSDAVLELIRTEDEIRDLLANAEVITIGAVFSEWETPVMTYAEGGECGGADNQDCLREALSGTVARTEAIFDEVGALRGPDEALISTFKIGTWLVELFCEWDSECWKVLAGYFIDLFDSIERIAIERDIRVVNALEALHAPGVYEAPINQDYLISDRVHLSEEGSAIVANLLRDLGYERATPGS
jgi:hypothetical protein